MAQTTTCLTNYRTILLTAMADADQRATVEGLSNFIRVGLATADAWYKDLPRPATLFRDIFLVAGAGGGALRGPTLASLPFFNRKAVVALLDRLPAMDQGSRVAYDQVLMVILSACVLQERYRLAA
jgi:hypothetical protein